MSQKPEWPDSYDDLEKLHAEYISEGETDEDAFTHKEIDGGRSYFFYGRKVMELRPAASVGKPCKWRILDGDKFVTVNPGTMSLPEILEGLRGLKRTIFRGVVTETFGCCNNFEKCSDARRCLIADDRFSNGCMYRKNLEAGRIFYGRNRNV